MGKITTLRERQIINDLAAAGVADREIAELLGWSIPTVRKWRRRGSCQGRQGLASTMGRPATGPLSTFPALIRETIRAWRKAHPGWGPKTLRAELEADEPFKGRRLPSQRSIARFLEAEKVTRRYERHSELPQSSRVKAQTPHEAWEMDARGHEHVPGVGMVTLININDLCSRLRLLSYPCWLGTQRAERGPSIEDYQLVLRLAFTDWGLPDRIAVDRDTTFYESKSKSPFPTRLHLWLLALGVTMTFGRPSRPTDQSVTERSHQLWDQQSLVGQGFAGWEALYQALRQRRDFLNLRLPCASLGEVPPWEKAREPRCLRRGAMAARAQLAELAGTGFFLGIPRRLPLGRCRCRTRFVCLKPRGDSLGAYPEATIPRRPYRPEWEAEMLDLSRIYAYLAQGRWYRLVSSGGTISLGAQTYWVGRAWARQQVEITFDPLD